MCLRDATTRSSTASSQAFDTDQENDLTDIARRSVCIFALLSLSYRPNLQQILRSRWPSKVLQGSAYPPGDSAWCGCAAITVPYPAPP